MRRWKRLRPEIVEQLQTRLAGSPAERLAQTAQTREPLRRSQLQQASGLSAGEFEAALQTAQEEGLLVDLGTDAFISRTSFLLLTQQLGDILEEFHEQHPLRVGMPKEELRSRMGLKTATFNALLERQEQAVILNQLVHLAGRQIQLTDAQRQRAAALLAALDDQPYTPPSYTEAANLVSKELLDMLIDLGDIVQVQADVIFSRAAYEALTMAAFEMIDQTGSVTAAALRDRFGASRKYVIGLLEYLDARGLTRRSGDVRVRGARATAR